MALKQKLLQQMNELEISDSFTDESGETGSPTRKDKSSKEKDKGYELDFFFGNDGADKGCP